MSNLVIYLSGISAVLLCMVSHATHINSQYHNYCIHPSCFLHSSFQLRIMEFVVNGVIIMGE